jgi:hypothetical protein
MNEVNNEKKRLEIELKSLQAQIDSVMDQQKEILEGGNPSANGSSSKHQGPAHYGGAHHGHHTSHHHHGHHHQGGKGFRGGNKRPNYGPPSGVMPGQGHM